MDWTICTSTSSSPIPGDPPTHPPCPQYEIKSNCVCFPLSSTLRLRAPSYFVNTETPEVIWQAAEKNSLFLYPGSHVALSVKEARIHNIHCRPIESGRNDLLQDRDGDRGEGVRDQVRHRPCLLPGWECFETLNCFFVAHLRQQDQDPHRLRPCEGRSSIAGGVLGGAI